MAYPNIPDYEEDELAQLDSGDDVGPLPASSIAGDQTPQDKVGQRISDIRNPAGADGLGSSPVGAEDMGPSPQDAMRYAQGQAQAAGYGRAINSLASATGYKADNSAYDAMEKGGRETAEKAFERAAQVKKYIAANELKKKQMEGLDAHRKSEEDYQKKSLGIKQAGVDAMNNRTRVMTALSGNKADTANIRASNSILNDKNLQKEVAKLNAASGAQSLVEGIRSGDVKDSKNISKQLTNLIATIEMGSPGGVGDRQAMGVDTLYGKLQGAVSYLTGDPKSTIPADYLNQLESEVHALGDRAAYNYKNTSEGLLKGADLSMGNPDTDTGKVYQLAKNRRDQFMKVNGYDPETGQPIKARDHGTKNSPGSGLINDAHAGSGKVIVSNGKETLSIDLTDLPDAIKDGYQAVKRKK